MSKRRYGARILLEFIKEHFARHKYKSRRPEQGAESAGKGIIIMTNCESKVSLGSWD